jgi:glycosyltransferase involved in cell wall biosynthesis
VVHVTPAASPLVSVVTPFHNTARFLAQCIESVLAQTYGHIEYVLVDNASTDGSTEIAAEFAARDRRVRFLRCEDLVPQVANYNRALRLISPASRYCKMVQADDWIFPECLEQMVAVAESSDQIGLVSSLRYEGVNVRGDGLPCLRTHFTGREVGQFHLLRRGFLFGTPTTVLVRSDIVRSRPSFYEEGRFQEDTEACYEICKKWDFGYVHQILSYSRVDDDSIHSQLRRYDVYPLGNVICAQRYGRHFFSEEEAQKLWRLRFRSYHRHLARALLSFQGTTFWKFHASALKDEGMSINWGYVTQGVALEILDVLGNPKAAIGKLARASRRDIQE